MPEQKLKYIERQLVESFEGFLVDGICAYAPTGEKFITYCSAGSKPEGRPTKAYSTTEKAVDAFEKTIRDIIKMSRHISGTLYWRMRPQLEKNKNGSCYVRSRFLISNKPVHMGTLAEYYNERLDKEERRLEDIYEATVGWFN